MADIGARRAVDTAVDSISTAVQSGRHDFAAILTEGATEARNAVVAAARDHGAEPRDLASTLLITVCDREGGAALQIGDGVIVVGQGDNGWCWVFWPQSGEYANTTNFLTDENAEKLIEIKDLPGPVIDIALLTDGLQPLALHYASNSVHEPFFTGIFAPLLRSDGRDEITYLSTALEAFLASEPVTSRVDDDVSLILATRRPILTQT